MRSQTIKLAILALAVLLQIAALADRTAPEPVTPIIHDGIEYRAPHRHMAHVEAWDVETATMLWEKRIYTVRTNPIFSTSESGAVFITWLGIDGGKLIVINDSDQRYRVDLRTGDVEGTYWPTAIGILAVAAVVLALGVARRRRRSRARG